MNEHVTNRRRYLQGVGATSLLGLTGCLDALDDGADDADDENGTDDADDENGTGEENGSEDDGTGDENGDELPSDDDFGARLYDVAADTWNFFEAFTEESTGLVPDRVDASGEPARGVTSPANTGVQLLSVVAASELDLIDADEGSDRAGRVLETVEDLERWNGHFYRWYDVSDGAVDEDAGGWWEISTVDNGWLTAGLAAVGGAFPSLRDRVDDVLDEQDYDVLYDPEAPNPFGDEPLGQLYGGFDARSDDDLGFHYDVLNTETRIANYVAIGKGDVPRSLWWHVFRTWPPGEDQSQEPEGEFVTYDGEEVWQGHYEHDGVRYVPSWGGSMFESLMPSLVVPEPELATEGLGENNARQVQLQIDRAAEQGYDAWGFSPCATPDGYAEFAVDHAGIGGYERDDFATPHATFLGLEYADEADVEAALDAYEERGLDTEYGFYDSMSVVDESVTEEFLVLDQAMSLVAIANHLTDGGVRDAFREHPVGSEPEDLLAQEDFGI